MTELQQRVRACPVICLDTVTFIYHFEDNPTYASLTELIFADIEAGTIEAIASTIAFAEAMTGAKKAKSDALALRYRAIFANYPHLTIMPLDMQVAERVADIRCRYGLKAPDAIAVATALVHHAQALVTNDRNLRRVAELDVILLADYVGV